MYELRRAMAYMGRAQKLEQLKGAEKWDIERFEGTKHEKLFARYARDN